MSDPPNDLLNDDDLKAVWGPPTAPDFEAWIEKHAESVAYLNPVVTQFQQGKRRIFTRTLKLSVLSLCMSVAIWLIGSREGTPAYAEALKSLKDAQTVTLVKSNYMQYTSKDRQRTWTNIETSKLYYRHPGLEREEFFNESGDLVGVQILDTVARIELWLDPSDKSAVLTHLIRTDMNTGGPLSIIEYYLRGALELVTTVDGPNGPVNLFRNTVQESKSPGRYIQGGRHDFLIDAKTKQLVEYRDLNLSFDPQTAVITKNPRALEKDWTATSVGEIWHDIVLNVDIDPELFSLKPPADYTLETKERPTATEEEMVEYFGASAKVHNGIFGVGDLTDSDLYRVAANKDKGDRTEKEQEIVDLVNNTLRRFQNKFPEELFITDHTIPGSCRYIGKGVKLGEKDRIVCWYRLKTTGQYRAVYGDLTVKDIDPKDLPLEVK